MLRFLGFMTGSLLTAALALAVIDPVTLETLRRSAATLFLGPERAAPLEALARTAGATAASPAEVPPARVNAESRPEAGGASSLAALIPTRHATAEAASGEAPAGHETGAPGLADGPSGDGPEASSAEPDADRHGDVERGAPDGASEAETGPDPQTRPASRPESGPGSLPADVSGETAGLAVAADRVPPPGEGGPGSWHPFWTPFHSEASAAGFARHLERATGERYRIIRTGPGDYRVAFWHADETERSRQLLAIERASGLSLRGGEL